MSRSGRRTGTADLPLHGGRAPTWLFQRPARFSFAHGGKDGHPYPVDRLTYDQTIEWLESALRRARLGNGDRVQALKRLAVWPLAP